MNLIGRWVECDGGKYVNLDQVIAIEYGEQRLRLETSDRMHPYYITTRTPESLTRTILRKISNRNFKDGELEN